MIALRAAQPAVPQTVAILNHKLPEMKDSEEIEIFVAMFEAALRTNDIPQAQWKAKLHSHLTPKAKVRKQSTIQDYDSTYDEVKEALLGCSNMTFSAATETLMSGDRGKLYNLEHRQCRDKLKRLAEKVTRNAKFVGEALDAMVVDFMRQNVVPSLKTCVDMKGQFDVEEFSKTLDKWESTQPVGIACFRKQGLGVSTPPNKQSSTTSFPRKLVICFFCGKIGHMSRVCPSRLVGDKPVQQQPGVGKTEPQKPSVNTTPTKPVKREITCFTWQQKGHKSPQCPQKKSPVRTVQIPSEKVVTLRDNELFGSVGLIDCP